MKYIVKNKTLNYIQILFPYWIKLLLIKIFSNKLSNPTSYYWKFPLCRKIQQDWLMSIVDSPDLQRNRVLDRRQNAVDLTIAAKVFQTTRHDTPTNIFSSKWSDVEIGPPVSNKTKSIWWQRCLNVSVDKILTVIFRKFLFLILVISYVKVGDNITYRSATTCKVREIIIIIT